MSDNLTCEAFSPHVGETFRLSVESGDGLDLELVEAEFCKTQDSTSDRKPFALVFRGPPEPCLQQQIFSLDHDKMGTLDIFLVPIGPDEKGMRYEAVFS
jgi:hypothetical protein